MRRTIPLPNSLNGNSQFNLDKRRKQSTKTHVLHQPGLLGSRRKIHENRKMALSLIIASRKLRPYFQVHAIMVTTDQPIKKAMNKLDAASRLIQWAVELSQLTSNTDLEQPLKHKYLLTS